jgi:ABC-2 type transporter
MLAGRPCSASCCATPLRRLAASFGGERCSATAPHKLELAHPLVAGFYSTWPYAIAQGSVEGPYLLVQSLLYAPLTYFLIGLEYSAGETHERRA